MDFMIVSEPWVVVDWVFVEQEFFCVYNCDVWLLFVTQTNGGINGATLEYDNILDEMEFLATPYFEHWFRIQGYNDIVFFGTVNRH